MLTQYDKAIAGFLTSLLGVLGAFHLDKYLPWINSAVVAAITPFISYILIWAIPNVPAPTPPPAEDQ